MITASVSRQASIAIFNLLANAEVVMLYPIESPPPEPTIQPDEGFNFPPKEWGKVLEMVTLNGHKADKESFMVVAVPVIDDSPFQFTDHFSADRQLYKV